MSFYFKEIITYLKILIPLKLKNITIIINKYFASIIMFNKSYLIFNLILINALSSMGKVNIDAKRGLGGMVWWYLVGRREGAENPCLTRTTKNYSFSFTELIIYFKMFCF